MNFNTPFSVSNEMFYDSHMMPLQLSCMNIDYPSENISFPGIISQGINMLRICLDDTAPKGADGFFTEEQLIALDKIIDESVQYGIYITLRPLSYDKLSFFDADNILNQQNYLSRLFTRRSSIDGKRLYEYPNIVALEFPFNLSKLSTSPLGSYIGGSMLRAFTDHYFGRRIVKIYSLEHGPATDEQRKMFQDNHIHIVNDSAFKPQNNSKLKFGASLPGIPDSLIRAGISKEEDCGWSPIAVADCMSFSALPTANGGKEGWLTYAADIPVKLRLEFPCPVKTAKFRPSLIEELIPEISGNIVTITIPSARYGVLEINYENDSIPHYTVYILSDNIEQTPSGPAIHYLAPGLHSVEDLYASSPKMLYFLPGLHEIAGNKLPLKSNCNVHIAQGAVVRAGIIAEEVENVKITGLGILDGTTVMRDTGEIKGERIGGKWREAAGREAFVCFYKGKNITWDGPVIYNANYWNLVISATNNVTIRNHKCICWLLNTDGIQPRSCSNLLIEHCFFKCADDCIAIKTRRALGMESRNITCRDLVLWHDIPGNGLEIGHTSQADILEDVTFKDIYVVHGANTGYCLGMTLIDHQCVRNISYENIYVEGSQFERDFCFRITDSYYTTDDECGQIYDISIKGYHSEKSMQKTSTIQGFDEANLVKNISFEDIYENCGRPDKMHKIISIDDFLGSNIHSQNIIVKS